MIGGGVSPVPRAARQFQGQPAGVATRCAAAVLDAFVVLGILFVGYWMLIGLVFAVDPLAFRFPRTSGLLIVSVATAVAALLRALACLLFPLGLLWSAVNAQNRSLQDLLLRTSVIYDWRSRIIRAG